MPTFVINDETQTNSYGFRVKNAGINLKRFLSNPVMLDEHTNSTAAVLGRWTNVHKSLNGVKTLADSEFDVNDPIAKRIAEKVDRGFIKGCSMGITFDRNLLQIAPDGVPELTQCELFEVSICAIPSNANAVTLFSRSGEILSVNEVQLSLAALQTNRQMPNTPPTLNLAAAFELADLAIGEGKILADQRQDFANMAVGNMTMAKALLATLPSMIVTSVDEFAGLPQNLQMAYKRDNPQAYANLFLPANKRVFTAPKPKLTVPANLCSTLFEYQALTTEQCLAFKEQHPDEYKALFKKDEEFNDDVQTKAYSMNLRTSYDYINKLNMKEQHEVRTNHPDVYDWLFRRR